MDFHFGSGVYPSLIKVMEEAGEFVQAATKLMGSRNWVSPWPQRRHLDAVREEANDLMATLEFLFEANPELDDPGRRDEKLAKFRRWHREQR